MHKVINFINFKFRLSSHEKILAYLLIFVAVYNILCLSIYFYKLFPTHYNITELLISYNAGFVRRGLFGYILSHLTWLPNFGFF